MKKTERLLALDVFRGMTIAFMILVNTPGTWNHVFPPLLHASWHGCTPTDLVFPFFLFIVGVSMYFSFAKYDYQLSSESTKKILRRTALIFLIGLALNWFPFYHKNIADLRIMGVLQRIALAYGIGAFLCLLVPKKRLLLTGAGILLGYWALLYFGGGDAPYEKETNFARVVDIAVFGKNHVWTGFGFPFDPEGLVSTIPAVVTVLLGFLAGDLIKNNQNRNIVVKNLLMYGAIGIFIGLAWGLVFPINKALWTSPYVLYTAGIGAIVLGICIEVLDIRKNRGWEQPFVVFGMNPLIIYALSGVIVKVLLYIFRWKNEAGEIVTGYGWAFDNVFAAILPNHLKVASLLFALSVVAICWLFGWLLYRKNIFIKV